MDAKTKEALLASIKHWEENLAAESPEQASVDGENCALCQTFTNCRSCPVFFSTGLPQCENTPYYLARVALQRWKFAQMPAQKKVWEEAAQAEIDFLKSLLPEGEE